MDAVAWMEERRARAVGRARLAGVLALLALLACAGWLAWREARQPAALRQALAQQEAAALRTRLKILTHAIYTAKVAQNALLAEIIGRQDIITPCFEAGDLRNLPPQAPCRALWEAALPRVWGAAYGPQAPPVPDYLLRDPWGSPYLLNPAEFLCGLKGEWCPHDDVGTAGPDGRGSTPDDVIVSAPMHLGPSRIAK